jgi:hypothetical protein
VSHKQGVCPPWLHASAKWHTFWNAGDELGRILEIIPPAGFDQFCRKAPVLSSRVMEMRRLNEPPITPDPHAAGAIAT